jgi:hypothetical protein
MTHAQLCQVIRDWCITNGYVPVHASDLEHGPKPELEAKAEEFYRQVEALATKIQEEQ